MKLKQHQLSLSNEKIQYQQKAHYQKTLKKDQPEIHKVGDKLFLISYLFIELKKTGAAIQNMSPFSKNML